MPQRFLSRVHCLSLIAPPKTDFNITKRTIIDMVPKAIVLNLVQHAKETLQRELLAELYNPSALEELLKESEHVVTRRKECAYSFAVSNRFDCDFAHPLTMA